MTPIRARSKSGAPLYFAYTADSNPRLRDLLDDAEPSVRVGVADLERCRREEAIVIDGRPPEVFASGHLRGSINVGVDGRFAEYAGDVVRPGQPLVVVTDQGRETEAKGRLARIGFDRVRGAVVDVECLLADRSDLAAQAARLAARDLASWRDEEQNLQIIDVRNPSAHETGVVPSAMRVRLPGSSTATGISIPPRPPSCTAPPATDPRSLRRCCDPWASPQV
ncbi:MAG TPA: rhodanese-like domain-containing protein, partial [Jiangellaceae bacterium]|nr:rhodanese-like domain-containing protein [Jiangellaceae bacterium]